jgi:hypothetical protein
VLSVDASPLSFLPSEPAALAVASVSFEEEPSAAKLTSPPAVRFRPRVEKTEWLASRSASERPMPALPPLVEPFAMVFVDTVCVACAVRPPVRLRSGPSATLALVVTFEMVMATCAESAKLPVPAPAPPSASVDAASVSSAVIVRL